MAGRCTNALDFGTRLRLKPSRVDRRVHRIPLDSVLTAGVGEGVKIVRIE